MSDRRPFAIANLRNCEFAKIPAAFLLSGALLAAAGGWPATAAAQTQDESLAIEALAHADTIELAWRTLEAHIERQSTATTSWGGNTPPAATGWEADWTLRGLGGRYCDDVLVVFADRPTLKGVGTNQRAVRLAPHVRAVSEGRVYPPLHWLAAGVAEGELGRASLTLPACMASLPLNRVALAGRVVDPWGVTNQRIVRRQTEDRVCPTGQHGVGQTWERPWTQDFNGRGEPIGTEVAGTWGIKVDRCRADYTVAELYTVACPSGSGEQVWRRHRTVTSDGETFTIDPVPVSNTCTVGSPPPPPTPTTNAWDSTSYQYRTSACPSTHTGSGRRYRRTVTHAYESTQWPWDDTPTQRLVNVGHSNWLRISSDCRRIPPPPPPPPPIPNTASTTQPIGPTASATPPDENAQADTPGSTDSVQSAQLDLTETEVSVQNDQDVTPVTPVTPETEDNDQNDENGNVQNNQGGGNIGTGIDVDGDGQSDFSNAQDASEAGFTGDQMSVGFGEPTPGSEPPSADSSDGDDGGGHQGGGGGPSGSPSGGHQGGFNGNTGPGGFGGATGA